MFHTDVAKVDRDIAHVAMVVHVCCKLLLVNVSSVFSTHVTSVFIWMLHIFHTYDANVLSGCCEYLQWFQVFFRCFCKCFGCMFQIIDTNFGIPKNV